MLKAKDRDKPFLISLHQTQGGEGIRVTDVTGFNIEDIKIAECKGRPYKGTKSRDVVFRNVCSVG